jgi:lipopolysaccharide biosynthesis regulator YciM
MSVFDIYDEDHYCLNGMDEQLAKCFHKACENACSEQLLKCSSKKLKTEQTIACLYYALEQQQNDEKVAVYVQQRRDPSLKVLVTHEIRKEKDYTGS